MEMAATVVKVYRTLDMSKIPLDAKITGGMPMLLNVQVQTANTNAFHVEWPEYTRPPEVGSTVTLTFEVP